MSTKWLSDESPFLLKRRDLLRILVALGIASPVVASLPILTSIFKYYEERRSWPEIRVATIPEITKSGVKVFDYPLRGLPNMLVKLGVEVPFGVGPSKDIVAFNILCQHLGCVVKYMPASASASANRVPPKYRGTPVFYCPCHGAVYAIVEEAKPVAGPARYKLPRVLLKLRGEDIIAYKMTPPVIYGKGPLGSDDVDLDLQGGVPVG